MCNAMRQLKFESLEQKQMLAGDVVVSVVGGVLTLEGDELDNQVVVSSGEEAGTFVVRGLDGTQLILGDAEPATEVVVEDIRGLAARLGDGNDALRIEDASIRGNVVIGTGSGNDRVVIGLRPEVTPAVGEEGDANVKLGQSLIIQTGEGNDTVLVDDTVGRGGLHVGTGAGDDTVRIGRPEDGTPGDEAAVAAVDDTFDVSFRRGVHVSLGAGTDVLGVNQLRTAGLHADGGAGADNMRLTGVHAHGISVQGGRGDDADQVAIRDSTTQLLFASLGGGDDTLTLGGVKAQLALLLGGRGEGDTLTLLGENMIRRRVVSGFETINRPDEPVVLARRR